MRRGILLSALLAVLAWATPASAAAPAVAERAAKAPARTAAAKKKRTAAAKKKRSKKRRKEVSRTPNRRTATNMPRGWRWPPSKAMLSAGERCATALESAGVQWQATAREGKIVTPLAVTRTSDEPRSFTLASITYQSKFRAPPYTMDCHLALALATHGPALYELGVRKVVFGSIFRFTKVRAHGKTKNVLSRHALGLAMDVVSFEDDTGAVHDVLRDYNIGDELLRAVEDTLNGSGAFRTVLTPRNDPTSHHDHFHLEADVAYFEDERHLVAAPPDEDSLETAGAGQP